MTKRTDDLPAYFASLLAGSPRFRVPGERVAVLRTPRQFYDLLKEKASTARRRISLAALYLGNGDAERQLVSLIEERLSSAAGSNVNVDLLLDHSRGTRGPASSVDVLGRLLRRHKSNVRVHLFHSPDLRGWLKRCLPQRWNEVVGLQHIKIYVFDDDVVISGANLSESYFDNRQDRYVHFSSCPELADFCVQLLGAVHSCSLKVEVADGDGRLDIVPDESCDVHPYLGDRRQYSAMLRGRLERVLRSHSGGGGCEPACDPLPGASGVQHRSDSADGGASEAADTTVYPLLQYGAVGVDYENAFLRSAFAHLAEPAQCSRFGGVCLASGYFNARDEFAGCLARAACPIDVVIASPLANGFYGASGAAGYIPAMYSWAARRFMQSVHSYRRVGSEPAVAVWEYVRSGWTFHSKGMWWRAAGAEHCGATLVGSSNYGYRSERRDLEAQFLLVTGNAGLQRRLADEHHSLTAVCRPVGLKHTFARAEHHIPLWVKLVSRFIRRFF